MVIGVCLIQSMLVWFVPMIKVCRRRYPQKMEETVGCKPFLLYHDKAFPQHVIYKANEEQDDEFKKHVKLVPVEDVPEDANVIYSHTVYKIKM